MAWLRRQLERVTICAMHGHDVWPLEKGLEERAQEWLGEPLCLRCGKTGVLESEEGKDAA